MDTDVTVFGAVGSVRGNSVNTAFSLVTFNVAWAQPGCAQRFYISCMHSLPKYDTVRY